MVLKMQITKHWLEREFRIQFIKDKIGIGNPVNSFRVDKGHPDGPEIHTLTDTGIIIIKNAYTGNLITMLIARPRQVQRYYERQRMAAPPDLIKTAVKHQKLGYNEI